MKKIFKWLFGHTTIADNDIFVALVQMAEEDSEIGNIIRNILHLKRLERIEVINEIIIDLKINKAPLDIIEAITYLKQEEVVERILEILQDSKNPEIKKQGPI